MRTTITLDEDLFRAAAEVLGTKGRSETVNQALAHVVTNRRRQAAENLDSMVIDLSEENMRGAWG